MNTHPVQGIDDRIYNHLYGLTLDELRYILDPKDVYGVDFAGETFHVLKKKDIKRYGDAAQPGCGGWCWKKVI